VSHHLSHPITASRLQQRRLETPRSAFRSLQPHWIRVHPSSAGADAFATNSDSYIILPFGAHRTPYGRDVFFFCFDPAFFRFGPAGRSSASLSVP